MQLIRVLLLVLVCAGCASPWYACYMRKDQDQDDVLLCAPIPEPQTTAPSKGDPT